MNRQWMYGDRNTREYIKGVHEFLDAAEANKQNGFMCCPCPTCGNMKSYSDRKILHAHLLYKGFMPHYNVWTRHGEIGVMMEDGEEEEYDDNYVPLEYGDAATGELVKIKRNQTMMCPMMLPQVKLLKIKRNQTMCPMMMISAGSLSMQGCNAKVKRRS